MIFSGYLDFSFIWRPICVAGSTTHISIFPRENNTVLMVADALISGLLPVLTVEQASSLPIPTTTVRWCVGATCIHVSTCTSFRKSYQVIFIACYKLLKFTLIWYFFSLFFRRSNACFTVTLQQARMVFPQGQLHF